MTDRTTRVVLIVAAAGAYAGMTSKSNATHACQLGASSLDAMGPRWARPATRDISPIQPQGLLGLHSPCQAIQRGLQLVPPTSDGEGR